MIHARLLTPKGLVYEGDVDELYFPSEKGPTQIATDYTPSVFAISPFGVLSLTVKGRKRFYAVFGGAVWVEKDGVSILCEEIDDGYTIDMARAIASRDRALDRISEEDPGTDVTRAKASLNRALTRINVKTLSMGEKPQ